MDKLNQTKVSVDINEPKWGTVTKLVDEKFNGAHVNGINVGYSQTGWYADLPTVGHSFNLGSFRSSMVTELLEDGKFRTLNSVYQLVEEVK